MHAVHVTTPSLERSRTPAVSRGINATSPDDGLEVKNLIKCKESKYVNTTRIAQGRGGQLRKVRCYTDWEKNCIASWRRTWRNMGGFRK
ncbi:unnamed protein product [Tenebrio molitor]|nr:unnamed protein product [Tenebrio molitor]